MSLKETIKDYALSLDIDFVRIASIERFAHAPAGHKPTDLLPSAKSVICLGIKIPEGVVESNNRAFEGLRHGIFPYMWFGYVKLNELLDLTALRVVRLLENKYGHVSLAIPASVPRDEEKLMGAFSNRHAAAAAGMGEFGRLGLVLHPETGPRIRFQTIITEAELEPDPLYEGPKLCKKCNACVEACPLQCLHPTEDQSVKIGEKTYFYALINKFRCRCGVSGLTHSTAGRANLDIPADGTMEEWLQIAKKDNVWNKIEREASMCGRCMMACPVGRKEWDNVPVPLSQNQ